MHQISQKSSPAFLAPEANLGFDAPGRTTQSTKRQIWKKTDFTHVWMVSFNCQHAGLIYTLDGNKLANSKKKMNLSIRYQIQGFFLLPHNFINSKTPFFLGNPLYILLMCINVYTELSLL